MKIQTIVSQMLVLLLFSATATGAAPTEGAPAFTAVLAYPHQSRSPEKSYVFRSYGKAYRFRLNPELDVNGRLVVFELLMEEPERSSRGANLLDSTGRLHGYQKWDFAASDFSHGAEKSIYGVVRTVDLPKRGPSVRIDIARVAVKPTPATSRMPANHQFTDLILRVRARPASSHRASYRPRAVVER